METFLTCDYDRSLVEQQKIKLEDFYKFPRLFANVSSSIFDNGEIEQQTTTTTNLQQKQHLPQVNGIRSNGLVAGSNDELLPFILQPSLFHSNNVPPTIYFKTKRSPNDQPPAGLVKPLRKLFRWKLTGISPNTIKDCISFMQFGTIKSSNNEDDNYIGLWCKHMLTKEYLQLPPWRKVNHYPGSFHIGRKDRIWVRIKLAMQMYGEENFGFHPRTFVMPRDYPALVRYWDQSSKRKLFIMKPPASSRGIGIQVINHISQIPNEHLTLPQLSKTGKEKKSTLIVQEYISEPCLLENGQKFDLRIYVLLTSIDPLRFYVYEDGLVRFASSKYEHSDKETLNHFMHLTNYYVNKKNLDYKVNNDSTSLIGSKWTLKRFWSYLNEFYSDRVDAENLWEQIKDIIVKTLICCETPIYKVSRLHCMNDYTSYELFGFDIILDKDFKPWILEVNITPSLKSESDLDLEVKNSVIQDIFNIAGYHLPPASNIGDTRKDRLFFDDRLYTEALTEQDCAKQCKFKNRNLMARNKIRPGQTDVDYDCKYIAKEYKDLASDSLNGVSIGQNGHHDTLPDCENIDFSILHEHILDDLTQNDIRVLMLSEDENSRRGNFTRLFPSARSQKYFEFFEGPRYYNLLLHAWEQYYGHDRLRGIERLMKSATFLQSSHNLDSDDATIEIFRNENQIATTASNDDNSNSIDSNSETSNIPSSYSNTSSPEDLACERF